MAEITEEAFALAHDEHMKRNSVPEGIERGETRKVQAGSKHDGIVQNFVRKTLPAGSKVKSIDRIRNVSLENMVNDHVKHQRDIAERIKRTRDEFYRNRFSEPPPSTWFEGTKETGYRFLYHGTDYKTMNKIIQSPTGFDPLHCARSLHGRGNYFSSDAEYSLNYSPVYTKVSENVVIKEILLVKVFVGLYQKGIANKPAGEVGYSHIKHNTMVNDLEDPTIFVTQSSSQQIPCYRITVEVPVQHQAQASLTSSVMTLRTEDEHIRAEISNKASKMLTSNFNFDRTNEIHNFVLRQFPHETGKWYCFMIQFTPGVVALDQSVKYSMAMSHTHKLITVVVDMIKSLLLHKGFSGTVEDFVTPYVHFFASGLSPSVAPQIKENRKGYWVKFFNEQAKLLIDTLTVVSKRAPEESSHLAGPAKRVKSK